MAVTITDNRTQVDGADATTGWSSPVAGKSVSNFTADPAPVELAGCNGIVTSNEIAELLFTLTSADLTGLLVYVWALGKGIMDTKVNGGIQLLIGDGTDTIGYDNAGSDVAVFRHSAGEVDWQCLLLDTGNLPSGFTVARGVEANLTLTAITELGAQFQTTVKAVGGVENTFVDQIRYGNGGIDILGGTSGDRGTFLEVATEDRDTTSTKAYGILRELGTGLYSCQGRMDFGETGTATHYFKDINFTVNWEDRSVVSGRYGVTLQSNATGVGSFELGEINGTENGKNGGSLIMPASSGAAFDASDATLDFCQMYDATLKNWTGLITFSDDATNGVNHDVFDCTFDTCGTVDPGRVDMKNTNFVNSPAAVTTGALRLNDALNTSLKNLDFISSGTGHAIHVIPVGAGPFSFTFTGYTYSGYGAAETNDATLLVDSASDADITITLSGGEVPTVDEAAGYTGTFTLVTSSVTTTINVDDNTGADLANVRVLVRAAAGGPEPHDVTVTITRSGTVATVTHTTHGFTSGDKVQIKGITDKTEDNNGTHAATVTGANTYTYVTTDSGSTSYTGTILATAVFIDGLTSGAGVISDSRPLASDQPIDGFARKSSATPRFKTFPLAGNTIDSVDGLVLTLRMILDE